MMFTWNMSPPVSSTIVERVRGLSLISASSPIPLAMSCVRRWGGTAWVVTASPSGGRFNIEFVEFVIYSFLFSTIPSSLSYILCQILEKWEANPAMKHPRFTAGAGSADGFGATRRGPWSDPDLLLGSAQNLGRWKRSSSFTSKWTWDTLWIFCILLLSVSISADTIRIPRCDKHKIMRSQFYMAHAWRHVHWHSMAFPSSTLQHQFLENSAVLGECCAAGDRHEGLPPLSFLEFRGRVLQRRCSPDSPRDKNQNEGRRV